MKFSTKVYVSLFVSALSSLLTLSVLAICALYLYIQFNLPDVDSLAKVQLQVPMRVYSQDHKLIAEFGEKHRIPVSYQELPPLLIKAVVATEDQRFYEHDGIDLPSLMRASITLVTSGKKSQGGSTITMQVARNYFLTRKKTYKRKFDEILLAIQIDRTFSKDKILELYFNKIFFGNRAYGVAAAAQVYYGKKLNQLTLPEMAMLAGLPKAPSTLNPLTNPPAALKRRNHVLERMLEEKYIDQKTYDAAIKEPVTARYHEPSVQLRAPNVAEMVRLEMVNRYGPEVYDLGYQITTTIDSRLQTAANDALNKAVLDYDKRHGYRGREQHLRKNYVEAAFVALNPMNGAIVALDGGFNQQSVFNRAVQSQRQPGSGIKPFLYSAALDHDMTLATVINDAPIVVDDPSLEQMWRPQNDSHKFQGPTRLRVGLVKSQNLVSIRILDLIGIPYTRDYLAKFGFDQDQLPKTLSLALGTNTVSPLQSADAYAVFANGGYKVTPYLIDHITDLDDKTIFTATPNTVTDVADNVAHNTLPAPQVISPQTAFLMTSAMQDVIKHGTGRGAVVLNRNDLAGKTGTTNDTNDAWFSGFNQNIVAVAWMGFDTPRPLHEHGARAALPMWVDFMRVALANTPEHPLTPPADIVSVRIDPMTGALASANQSNAILEYFTKANAPHQMDSQANTAMAGDGHGAPAVATEDDSVDPEEADDAGAPSTASDDDKNNDASNAPNANATDSNNAAASASSGASDNNSMQASADNKEDEELF